MMKHGDRVQIRGSKGDIARGTLGTVDGPGRYEVPKKLGGGWQYRVVLDDGRRVLLHESMLQVVAAAEGGKAP